MHRHVGPAPASPCPGRSRGRAPRAFVFLALIIAAAASIVSLSAAAPRAPADGPPPATIHSPSPRAGTADVKQFNIEPATAVVIPDNILATPLVVLPGTTHDIAFSGAPRWLSRIDLRTEGGPCEVLVRDRHDGAILAGVVSGDASLNLAPVRARGLRLRVPPTATPARIDEIAAAFDFRDPDDLRSDDSSYEVVVEWVNDYPWWEWNDLDKCDDDARGLKNKLPGTWSKWDYGNDSVWEDDFSNSSGQEETYTDPRDLVYFSGHGSSAWDWSYLSTRRTLHFGNQSHDDADLVPGDANRAWGDNDMEWICFSACQVLKDDGYWANAMNHLHLIMGWKTNMKDVDMGTRFGSDMVSSGASDPAIKIKQAWFNAAEATHGNGYTARVVGETWTMGDDYLWGQGTVAADPAVDGWYSLWEYSTSKDLAGLPGGAPAEATLAFARLAALERDHPPAGLVRVSSPRHPEHAVIYDPALAVGLPTIMNRFQVVPVTVTPSYVQEIANRLCAYAGRMCGGGAILPDDSGNLCMVDGDDLLVVSLATGAASLMNTELWLAERDTPALLPSESEARAEAQALLTGLGRVPAGGVPSLASWFRRDEVERGTGHVASSIPYNIQINYERELDGYPVVGPGANDAVAYGNGHYLERWSEGGWRRTTSPQPVTLLSLSQIIDMLAAHGSDCTIDGITVPADSIVVHSVSNGYYEYDRWTPQPVLEPIYILQSTIYFGDSDPVDYTIHINACHTVPAGSINAPPDGSWFNQGQSIQLQGSATGGTPPYTFEWSSDVDGVLGSGASITTILSVAYVDSVAVPHAVTLRVTDAGGCHDQVTTHIGVRSTRDLADHNVGAVTLTVTDQGVLGFTDDTPNHQGSGLVFGGQNLLWIGSPWLGTSASYLVNRDYSAEPAEDWTVSSDPDGHLLFGGRVHSDQDGYGIFTDGGHPAPRGARVEQHSWAFASAEPPGGEDHGVVLNYIAADPTGAIGPGAYVGVFLDLDIGDAAQNEGAVNAAQQYVAMWRAGGPYVGLALLYPPAPANLTLVHNPTYVYPNQYVPDLDKFLFLSGGDPAHRVTHSSAPSDWSIVASVGPYDLPAGGMTMAFAIAAAGSAQELEAAIGALRERYGEIGPAGIGAPGAPPLATRLLGAIPNPFNPTTTVHFELGERAPVRLRVFDLRGSVVSTLVDRELDPGRHAIPWDGRLPGGQQEVASGVYFLRLEAGPVRATQKLVVIR